MQASSFNSKGRFCRFQISIAAGRFVNLTNSRQSRLASGFHASGHFRTRKPSDKFVAVKAISGRHFVCRCKINFVSPQNSLPFLKLQKYSCLTQPKYVYRCESVFVAANMHWLYRDFFFFCGCKPRTRAMIASEWSSPAWSPSGHNVVTDFIHVYWAMPKGEQV